MRGKTASHIMLVWRDHGDNSESPVIRELKKTTLEAPPLSSLSKMTRSIHHLNVIYLLLIYSTNIPISSIIFCFYSVYCLNHCHLDFYFFRYRQHFQVYLLIQQHFINKSKITHKILNFCLNVL